MEDLEKRVKRLENLQIWGTVLFVSLALIHYVNHQK